MSLEFISQDDPRMMKYTRMKNAGLPQGAVENGMIRDKVDPASLYDNLVTDPGRVIEPKSNRSKASNGGQTSARPDNGSVKPNFDMLALSRDITAGKPGGSKSTTSKGTLNSRNKTHQKTHSTRRRKQSSTSQKSSRSRQGSSAARRHGSSVKRNGSVKSTRTRKHSHSSHTRRAGSSNHSRSGSHHSKTSSRSRNNDQGSFVEIPRYGREEKHAAKTLNKPKPASPINNLLAEIQNSPRRIGSRSPQTANKKSTNITRSRRQSPPVPTQAKPKPSPRPMMNPLLAEIQNNPNRLKTQQIPNKSPTSSAKPAATPYKTRAAPSTQARPNANPMLSQIQIQNNPMRLRSQKPPKSSSPPMAYKSKNGAASKSPYLAKPRTLANAVASPYKPRTPRQKAPTRTKQSAAKPNASSLLGGLGRNPRTIKAEEIRQKTLAREATNSGKSQGVNPYGARSGSSPGGPRGNPREKTSNQSKAAQQKAMENPLLAAIRANPKKLQSQAGDMHTNLPQPEIKPFSVLDQLESDDSQTISYRSKSSANQSSGPLPYQAKVVRKPSHATANMSVTQQQPRREQVRPILRRLNKLALPLPFQRDTSRLALGNLAVTASDQERSYDTKSAKKLMDSFTKLQTVSRSEELSSKSDRVPPARQPQLVASSKSAPLNPYARRG